ncbi:hydrogenase maturation nickel metallochaperone HypA [Marinobacterium sediminicola]|uniref:Hydrogenase maturation factor HypA n=1 Tax=Marinobacterium sediminicola TaxID=518898 RepID=A0ABY1RXJ2_9GAMM|nr:hydrogenase maturation nickel metallochaperone HypA [Marinobacterium sediminicola]ULG67767.1 hydrogenase maturation nickel metallochaperone HypA [Marinobacterium sediminicola]SMR71583.1 hydrogenase nickel incorporation protein HypA/HybF [Marinobacterium sediminicola]
MHELSLCRSLIELLQEQAEQHRFTRVKQLWLEVGPLAAVVPEAMQFAFEAASRGSLAEGARLHLVELPGEAHCQACGFETSISQWYQACPRCGEYQLKVLSGDELQIRELEVE